MAWAAVSATSGGDLPGPWATLKVLWHLVSNPFYDNGPNDKGIAIQLGSSLGRVFIGFSLATVVAVPFGIVIGAALVFLVARCRHEASFDYELEGTHVRLIADPGEGVSSLAKVEWDIDSNGTIDLVGREVTALAGEVSTVTMWIDDPISRERVKVKRVVREDAAAEGSK